MLSCHFCFLHTTGNCKYSFAFNRFTMSLISFFGVRSAYPEHKKDGNASQICHFQFYSPSFSEKFSNVKGWKAFLELIGFSIPDTLEGSNIEFPRNDPEKVIHGCWALLEALSGIFCITLRISTCFQWWNFPGYIQKSGFLFSHKTF